MAISSLKEKKIETFDIVCQGCGVEITMIVKFAPAFVDFSPICPYCHEEITP